MPCSRRSRSWRRCASPARRSMLPLAVAAPERPPGNHPREPGGRHESRTRSPRPHTRRRGLGRARRRRRLRGAAHLQGLRAAEALAGQGAALLGGAHGEDRGLLPRLLHHDRLRAARGRGQGHAAHARARGGVSRRARRGVEERGVPEGGRHVGAQRGQGRRLRGQGPRGHGQGDRAGRQALRHEPRPQGQAHARQGRRLGDERQEEGRGRRSPRPTRRPRPAPGWRTRCSA